MTMADNIITSYREDIKRIQVIKCTNQGNVGINQPNLIPVDYKD